MGCSPILSRLWLGLEFMRKARRSSVTLAIFALIATPPASGQTPIKQDFSFEDKADARQSFAIGMTIQEVRERTPGGMRPSFAKRIDGTFVQVFQVVQTYGRKLGPLAPPSWTQKKNDLYLYFVEGKLLHYDQPGDWEKVAEQLVRDPASVISPPYQELQP